MPWVSSQTKTPSYNPRAIVNKTASYTATVDDDLINVDTTTATATITLPSIDALQTGLVKTVCYKIVHNSSSSNITRVTSNSADVIGVDEATTLALPTVNGAHIILKSHLIKTSSSKYMWEIDYQTQVELKWAGNLVTVGGNAVETFTVAGLATTDLVNVTIATSGATPVTVLAAYVSAANTLSVTFSSNPSSDHTISVTAYRVTT